MAQLRTHKREIDAAGLDVVFIGFGSRPKAEVWMTETGVRSILLLDRRREVYRLYGLHRSLAHAWNVRTVRRYITLMGNGNQWRGIQGDSAQMGGDFAVGVGGTLFMAWPSREPTDRPSVAQILASVEHRADPGRTTPNPSPKETSS